MTMGYLEALGEDEGPLQRKSLKSEIFDLLHGRIVAGEYAPGTWLRQEEIASELGVSPTPVREALDQLVAEGLAQRIPYRGVRVPHFTEAEIVDAYMVRLLLEAAVARLAAYNITAEQSTTLRSVLSKTENLLAPDDMPAYRRLNRQIHRIIASVSGNPLLARIYSIALNRFPDWMLYEDLLRQPDLLRASLEREFQEHEALVEAVTSHNVDLAAQRATEHLRSVSNELVSSLGVSEAHLREKEQQIWPLLGQ